MKNMFSVTTVLPHNLLQTNPCIRHDFSTQVFRKRAAQLHYLGHELLVPNEEHVQCDHRFASQLLANEPLHSSQLFDTSVQKRRAAQLHYVGPELRYIFWPPLDECKGSFARSCEAKRWSH